MNLLHNYLNGLLSVVFKGLDFQAPKGNIINPIFCLFFQTIFLFIYTKSKTKQKLDV